jgi:hypothetical protein
MADKVTLRLKGPEKPDGVEFVVKGRSYVIPTNGEPVEVSEAVAEAIRATTLRPAYSWIEDQAEAADQADQADQADAEEADQAAEAPPAGERAGRRTAARATPGVAASETVGTGPATGGGTSGATNVAS